MECTVNGIGERAGNAALEEIVMALHTRRDTLCASTGIHMRQIYRTSKLLYNIIGTAVPMNKPIVGANAFKHEAGIHQHGVLENTATYEIMSPETIGVPKNHMVLGKHSGKHAFQTRLSELGYSLSEEETARYFREFKTLCDKKKVSPTATLRQSSTTGFRTSMYISSIASMFTRAILQQPPV